MKHPCEAHHRQHFTALGIPEEFHPREIETSEEEYAAVFAGCKHSNPLADVETLHTKTLGVLASRQHASAPVGADIPQHLKDEAQQNEFTRMRHHLRQMSKEGLPDLKKELDDIEEAVKCGNRELAGLRSDVGKAAATSADVIVGALNMNQSGLEKIAEDIRLDRAEDREIIKQFGWGILALLFLLIVATLFAPRAHGQFSHINSIQLTNNDNSVQGFVTYPFTIKAGTNCSWSPSASTFTFNCPGGSGSPGGLTTQVQFNDAGSFAGNAQLIFNKTNHLFSVGTFVGFTTDTQAYVDEAQQVNIASLNAITPTLNTVLAVSGQDNSTNNVFASYFEFESTHAAGNRSTVETQGADVYHSGAGTVTDMFGMHTLVDVLPGGGSVTNATGLAIDISQESVATMTNAYGVHVNGFSRTAGTLSNAYGIKVEDQTSAGTNYAFYTGLGTVHFGDHVDATGQRVTATEYDSDQSNIATNGTIRLNKLDFIGFRNELNNGNINLSKDTSDRIASSGGFAGSLTGNVTGNVTGALTGNADTATTLATTRAIYGNNFNGSAALTQIIASGFGGTGNGFTKFSGATTSEKTYSLPDATTTILTTNAAVTVGQGGTGQSTTATSGRYLKGDGSNWGTSTGSASGVGTPTACTNQFVTGLTLNSDAAPTSTCTTDVLASAQHANQGTTTTVLHGNGAGNPSFAAVNLASGGDITGILTSANGGTGNGFAKLSGPASTEKTFTLPNASATVLTDNAAVTVAQGGTGLASGTSGGVPTYTASGTITSSGALTANLPVIGGGAGAVVAVGTRSGNTTAFVTTTGTQTSGDCVKIDANGNHVANGSACGGGTSTYKFEGVNTTPVAVDAPTVGTTETDLQTITLPSSDIGANQVLQLDTRGTVTFSGTPNVTLRAYWNSTLIWTAVWVTGGGLSNQSFHMQVRLIPSGAAGASVACESDGQLVVSGANPYGAGPSSTVTVATNAASPVVKFTAQWTSNAAGNNIQSRMTTAERLN